MLILPVDTITLLNVFAPLFSRRTWRQVPMLVASAILAPGQRMISSALLAVGLGQVRTFQSYHRVLNRAIWSVLGVRRILLGRLATMFAATGPLVVGIDETIERRPGPKIAAVGIYRNPARSSHSHFIKVNGLRWICLHLLVPIPWAGHTWALPFLTALDPSERYASLGAISISLRSLYRVSAESHRVGTRPEVICQQPPRNPYDPLLSCRDGTQ